MANQLRHFALLGAALLLLVGIGNANQITLGGSSGQVRFTNQGAGVVSFNFTGNCSHADCLSGLGLYGSTIGSYKMWITGGPPRLQTPNNFDIYPVNEKGATINFSMILQKGLGTITGTVGLEFLSGGSTRAPEFLGDFTTASASGLFVGAFPVGVTVPGDFTIFLPRTLNVDLVYAGTRKSLQGPLSSGEIIGTPEPASLGLLGSGLLTMAGLLRRRLF